MRYFMCHLCRKLCTWYTLPLLNHPFHINWALKAILLCKAIKRCIPIECASNVNFIIPSASETSIWKPLPIEIHPSAALGIVPESLFDSPCVVYVPNRMCDSPSEPSCSPHIHLPVKLHYTMGVVRQKGYITPDLLLEVPTHSQQTCCLVTCLTEYILAKELVPGLCMAVLEYSSTAIRGVGVLHVALGHITGDSEIKMAGNIVFVTARACRWAIA